MYILQSQSVKRITKAYKNYLQIITFPTSSGGVREKISYFIIKSYYKPIVAEQEEKPPIL